MSSTRSKVRSRQQVKPESAFGNNEQEWYSYLLQQAARQCRLFGKVAAIVYHIGDDNKEVTTSKWTTNNNTVVLEDGNQFPLQAIRQIFLH